MKSKKTKGRETKKQQKLDEIPTAITVRDTIALREAARALHQKAPLIGEGLDVRRILEGLQEARLASGFFLDDDQMTWIPIPATYWIRVTTKQFSVIRATKKSGGAYLVSPTHFADAYVRAKIEADARIRSLDEAWAELALKGALALADREFEVRLLRNAAWDEYQSEMLNLAIENSTLATKKKGQGAKEKGGWKVLYRTLAAHLIANNINSKVHVGLLSDFAKKMAGQALHESEGVIDLPGIEALIDEIGYLFDLIQRRRKK